jgi:hypothetical protein
MIGMGVKLYFERLNSELLFFDRITGLTMIVFRSSTSCYPVNKSFVLTRLKYKYNSRQIRGQIENR